MSLLALIVDDEAPARAELRYLLEQVGDVHVVGEAASVREALALASRVEYDVVFCDISMPELSGIDAAREIAAWPRRPKVVFVTAHEDYAVQAFSVDAFDYVLKPVSEERLARTVQRLRSALRNEPVKSAGPELAKVPVDPPRRDAAARPRRGLLRRGRRRLQPHRDLRRALLLDAVDARARGPAALGALLPHPPLVPGEPAEGGVAGAGGAGPLAGAAGGSGRHDARGGAAPDEGAQAAPRPALRTGFGERPSSSRGVVRPMVETMTTTASLLSRPGRLRGRGRGSISARLVRVFVFTIAMAGVTAGIGAYELHVGAERTTEHVPHGRRRARTACATRTRASSRRRTRTTRRPSRSTAKDYNDLRQEASDKMDEAIGGMRQYEAIAPASQKAAV